MRKQTVIGSLVILGILGPGLIAWALDSDGWSDGWGRHGRQDIGSRWMALLDNDRFKASLNLTDPQVNRLRQIALEEQKSRVKGRAEMAVRGIELRELLHADQPDREAVMKKVQEISDLRAQMMKQKVEVLLSAKNVLTPEQQRKMRSILNNFGGFRWRHDQSEGFHRIPPPRGRPEGRPTYEPPREPPNE